MRHSKTFCLFAITISQNLKFWSVVPYATTSSVWKTAEIYIEQSFHVIVLVGTELNWQESVFSHKPNKFEWTIMMYFQNKHSLIVFCLVVLSYCVQIGKYYKDIWIYVILKHLISVLKLFRTAMYLITTKSITIWFLKDPKIWIQDLT